MGINLKDYLGEYLTLETLDTEQLYTITSVEEKYSEAFQKKQIVLILDNGSRLLEFGLNKINLVALIEKEGCNTDYWTGKKLKFKIIETEVKGKPKKVLRID